MNLHFKSWLTESTIRVGKVTRPPVPDQIEALDRAVRKLAATDPLAQTCRFLSAYADGRPLPRE